MIFLPYFSHVPRLNVFILILRLHSLSHATWLYNLAVQLGRTTWSYNLAVEFVAARAARAAGIICCLIYYWPSLEI